MVEARIECRCPQFHVPDINLRLRRGDVVWVAEEIARRSVDLGIAVRSGAVSVVYSRRCTVSRPPPPPSSRMGRIIRSVGRTTVQVQTIPASDSVPAPTVDPKSIEDAIAKGVTRAIADLVASGVLTPGGSGAPVRVAPSVVGGAVVAEEPLYIPTNIVPADKANIKVAESSSEGSGLDEAAAALKATRRRRSTTTETP